MAYADFDYYSGIYMGTMDEEAYQRLSIRASSYLDYITLGKVKNAADTDAVKMCCCALADDYAEIEAASVLAKKRMAEAAENSGDLRSESVGSYSRTFAGGGESANAALSVKTEAQKQLLKTATVYLCNTGLLYRGGGRNCTLPTL